MAGKKLLVIGAGPGGYVAALRAARLGFDVTVAEKDRVGGVCLNVGCIPTKALLSATELGHSAAHAGNMGVAAEVSYDLEKLDGFRQACVDKLTGGVEFLFKRNGVKLLRGEAVFQGPDRVQVGDQAVDFDTLILAPGSSPVQIPGFEFDGERIISSTEALVVRDLPPRLLIIGAGVIGLEMAMIYRRLGVEVQMVEMMPHCLPGMDKDLVREAEISLKKLGVRLHTSCLARSCREKGEGLEVEVEKGEETLVAAAERILVSVGRKPNSAGLGLDRAGIETDEKGFIKVDENLRTTNPRVYAIGDATRGPQLAHRASAQGLQVVENLAGVSRGPRFRFVPSVVYTDPELASVGATEDDLKEQGIPYRVGKFPFAANGRAVAMGRTQGFVKILAHEETDEVLGAHIAGPGASDLVSELCLAMEAGVKARDLGKVVHPHPTLSEAVMEAAEDVHGAGVHIFRPRRPGE